MNQPKDLRLQECAVEFLDFEVKIISVAKTLPGQWEAYRDSSGRIFYFNHETNKSQWNIPVNIQDNDNISFNPINTTYNSRRYVRPHRTKIKSKYFSKSDANHQVSEDKNVENAVDSNLNENDEINKLNTSESSSLLHFEISNSSINSTMMLPSLDFNQSDVHIDTIVNTVIHAYRLSKGVYQWFSNNNRTNTRVSTTPIGASSSAHRPLRAGRKLSFLKTTKQSTTRKNRTIDVKRHDTTRSVSIAAQERAHIERLKIISQLTTRLKELESQCEESDQRIARLCTENTALLSSTKREWDEKIEVCSIQSECINNTVLDLIETLCLVGRCLYPTTTAATEYTVSNLPVEGELHSSNKLQAESVGFIMYTPVESLTNTTTNTSATTISTDNDNIITSTTRTNAEVYIKEKETQQGSLYSAALLAQLCVFLNTQSNSINVVKDTQCTQPTSTVTPRDASSSDHTLILRQTLENNHQRDSMLQQIDSLQESIVRLQRQNTALYCELELANRLLCQLRGQTITYPNNTTTIASIATTGTTSNNINSATSSSAISSSTSTAVEGIDFELERKQSVSQKSSVFCHIYKYCKNFLCNLLL